MHDLTFSLTLEDDHVLCKARHRLLQRRIDQVSHDALRLKARTSL